MEEYEITRDGRVISHKYGRLKELKLTPNSAGYYTIGVWIKGTGRKTLTVHRLVAEKYVPNPLNLPTVNHKDGNKLNNNDWNLEWATQQEQMIHAVKLGLQKCGVGETHWKTILTNDDVEEILILKNRLSPKEIAEMFNVSVKTIYPILDGTKWKHIKR